MIQMLMSKNKLRKNLGFTLIELLVVISIIGFLATASMVVLNSARVKARNVRRNSDITQLAKAFRLAADASGGILPSALNPGYCVSSSCYGNFSTILADATVDAAVAPFIKEKPDDPAYSRSGNGGYIYINPLNGGKGVGAYLLWLLELVVVTPEVCGPGWLWYTGADFLSCRMKID